MISNHLILCCTPSPSAFNLSQHRGLFQWVISSDQVATYWSFSFINSTSNEYWGLMSFRIEWFDLLAVRGILKSLLQHHISKVLILWCSVSLILSLILWCPTLTSVHDYWKTSPTATDQPHDFEKNCLFLCCFPVLEIRGRTEKFWVTSTKNPDSLWEWH